MGSQQVAEIPMMDALPFIIILGHSFKDMMFYSRKRIM